MRMTSIIFYFGWNRGKWQAVAISWGEAGVRSFAETYGLLEKITTIQPADNACSKARVTTQVKRGRELSHCCLGAF